MRYFNPTTSRNQINWVTILTLVGFSLYANGSCIFVVTTPRGVYLAADSQQTSSTGVRYRCKITRDRGFYWAASTPIYDDPVTGFDIPSIVKRVKYHGTLMDKMRAFIKSAKGPVAKEVATIRNGDQITYQDLISGKSALLEIVFVAMEQGSPAFVSGFFTAREVNGNVIVDGEPVMHHFPEVVGMGEWSEGAFPYLKAHREKLRIATGQVIVDSITAQEIATPQIVGGKVSVLRIDAQGAEWEAKGECQ
jgi:hypothetical protein